MSTLSAQRRAKTRSPNGPGTTDLVIDDLHGGSVEKTRNHEVMPAQGKPYPQGWPQEPKHPLDPLSGEQGGPHIATSELACVSVSARCLCWVPEMVRDRVTGWVSIPRP